MHIHICMQFQRRVAKQAAADFKQDSRHAKFINYDDFKFVLFVTQPRLSVGQTTLMRPDTDCRKGLFELVDVWVDAIDPCVYVDFLRKAFMVISTQTSSLHCRTNPVDQFLPVRRLFSKMMNRACEASPK